MFDTIPANCKRPAMERPAGQREVTYCIGKFHLLSRFDRGVCFLRLCRGAFERSRTVKSICSTLYAALAVVLMSGGLALAQGYAPGVNPSNPQDLTNRSNPQSLTVPGGSNPQDLVRSPAPLRTISPAPPPGLDSRPPVSASLGHTYVTEPDKTEPVKKPAKKFARRKHHVSGPQGD